MIEFLDFRNTSKYLGNIHEMIELIRIYYFHEFNFSKDSNYLRILDFMSSKFIKLLNFELNPLHSLNR